VSTPTCIVLAGGLGTRLGSVLNGLPKCLAPVGNRTFLDLQLDTLATGGVGRFVLSLGHGADAVLAQLPALRARHAVEAVVEHVRLGTGGGMLYAMAESGLNECLVINGDTFLDAPLAPMLEPLDEAGGERLRVATVDVPDRSRFGGLEVTNGRVQRFLEKGISTPGPINAGLYRVSHRAFGDRLPGTAFSFEQDIMPSLVAEGAVGAATTGGDFIDIGVPDDYRRFCSRQPRA
jgi:D-glycero-alpha-D-manno-heptose 1-phosphate guanylyltransferase